jgi:hypothetical protein
MARGSEDSRECHACIHEGLAIAVRQHTRACASIYVRGDIFERFMPCVPDKSVSHTRKAHKNTNMFSRTRLSWRIHGSWAQIWTLGCENMNVKT